MPALLLALVLAALATVVATATTTSFASTVHVYLPGDNQQLDAPRLQPLAAALEKQTPLIKTDDDSPAADVDVPTP